MARMKNLLPASLMKKPKTLEEFQEFFFYWEPNMPIKEHREENRYGEPSTKEDVKEFKLILWNARKIKKLTKSELLRIYSLYQGKNCFGISTSRYDCHFYIPDNKMKDEDYADWNGQPCIKFKGWKDSDNPKDPMIKIIKQDAESPYLFPDWLRDYLRL